VKNAPVGSVVAKNGRAPRVTVIELFGEKPENYEG
jgi:hypothetical protein